MAKEQNLSLNPTKISGICGRLMCCLKYESDCYACGCSHQVHRPAAPEQGSRVVTVDGEGKVISVNQQRRTVTVLLDNSRTVVAAWEDVVEKDEDEGAAPYRAPFAEDDDENDEVDAGLLAAIAERSARAEKLGEREAGEQPARSRRDRRERKTRPLLVRSAAVSAVSARGGGGNRAKATTGRAAASTAAGIRVPKAGRSTQGAAATSGRTEAAAVSARSGRAAAAAAVPPVKGKAGAAPRDGSRRRELPLGCGASPL